MVTEIKSGPVEFSIKTSDKGYRSGLIKIKCFRKSVDRNIWRIKDAYISDFDQQSRASQILVLINTLKTWAEIKGYCILLEKIKTGVNWGEAVWRAMGWEDSTQKDFLIYIPKGVIKDGDIISC